MRKFLPIILFVLFLCITEIISAQCPMCKTSLEEARKNGSPVGNSLNSGILYLLALPYSIAAVFGVIWWRNTRTGKQKAQ